jgi:hypothetical protein
LVVKSGLSTRTITNLHGGIVYSASHPNPSTAGEERWSEASCCSQSEMEIIKRWLNDDIGVVFEGNGDRLEREFANGYNFAKVWHRTRGSMKVMITGICLHSMARKVCLVASSHEFAAGDFPVLSKPRFEGIRDGMDLEQY